MLTLMLVDDVPEPRDAGVGRDALEHQGGGAVGERPVENVAVAGDPTDVGRAPVDVAFAVIEHVLVGQRRRRPGSRRWCAALLWACRSSPRCRAGTTGPRRSWARAGSRRSPPASTGRHRGRGLPPSARPCPVCRNIRTFTSGAHFSRALSAFSLSGTARPPRSPPSEVMISLELASLTRSDRLSGEKPPNTTECGAPMRAQASIA